MNILRLKPFSTNIYSALVYRLLVVMGLFTICRIAFYFINIAVFPGVGFDKFMIILLGGLKFDLVAVVYINLLYILLQAIPFAFRYKQGYQSVCKWIFYITNSIGLFANSCDFGYYRFTLKRTTFSVFQQFDGETNLPRLIAKFTIDFWYVTLLFILMVAALVYLYKRVAIVRPPTFAWKHYLTQSLLLVAIVGLVVVSVRGGWRHSTRPITLSNAGEFVDTPNEMSLVLNTPFTLLKTIKAVQLKPVATFDETTLKTLYNPLHKANTGAPFNKLNVVILVIESLGKEHIGALNREINNGTYKGYTPFLDSLVDQSFTFTGTYANGRKSIDALPSIISGIPSIREPFVLSTYSDNKTESLAQLLGKEGYATSFFHGAPNGSMGFSSFTKLAGIKHYYGKTEYNNDADFDGIWGIWDEPFLQFMAGELNKMPQPFFSTLFTVSSHHPFKVPEKYEGKFPKGPLPIQEPIGYTDMALRKYFQTASKMPWFNNTLFVICADHATISFLPEYQNIAGYFSIPILFYNPGGNLKGKSNNLVQQIDILPTVLNYLNYPKPYFAFGFDAFDEHADNFVVNNNEGVFNFYLDDYLLSNDGVHSSALYNLKTDRLMKSNLIGKLPEIQRKLEIKLKAFIQQHDNRMINNRLTAGTQP